MKPVLAIIAAVAAVFGWLAMRPDEATVAAAPSMPAVQAAATAVPVAAGKASADQPLPGFVPLPAGAELPAVDTAANRRFLQDRQGRAGNLSR